MTTIAEKWSALNREHNALEKELAELRGNVDELRVNCRYLQTLSTGAGLLRHAIFDRLYGGVEERNPRLAEFTRDYCQNLHMDARIGKQNFERTEQVREEKVRRMEEVKAALDALQRQEGL